MRHPGDTDSTSGPTTTLHLQTLPAPLLPPSCRKLPRAPSPPAALQMPSHPPHWHWLPALLCICGVIGLLESHEAGTTFFLWLDWGECVLGAGRPEFKSWPSTALPGPGFPICKMVSWADPRPLVRVTEMMGHSQHWGEAGDY